MCRYFLPLVCAAALAATLVMGIAGCVNVQAPEKIEIGGRRGSEPIDTSRLPPTASHEEARERLAEAYDRIAYLEAKVRDLEEDKRELKREKEDYKDRYEREKKRRGDD